MSLPHPVPEAPAPDTIHGQALASLTYIRRTMEDASAFTAVPGWGGVLMGLTALAAAPLAASVSTREAWLAVWIGDAIIALAIGGWAMARKARRAGVRVSRGAGRRFVLALSPPLLAAVVLTLVLYRGGLTAELPGVWLLLYGTGIVTAGAFSIRAIPFMGLSFMLAGCAALLVPAHWAEGMMAFGFGGLHVLFGAIIAWRYGG